MKISSLPKYEHLTIGKKYCEKEEKLLLESNFSSFPQYFQYISNFKSKSILIHLLKVVVRFILFLNSANLICRVTDISKYFRESLGIRDNESRLYFSNTVVLRRRDRSYYSITVKTSSVYNAELTALYLRTISPHHFLRPIILRV